jgi:hypothetical protein
MVESVNDSSAPPHPDSILRLVSAVHRFSIVSVHSWDNFQLVVDVLAASSSDPITFKQPYINPSDQLKFDASFKTCAAGHKSTLAAIREADGRRQEIKKNMADGKLNHAALSKAVQEYM